jgi:hypothetical protein
VVHDSKSPISNPLVAASAVIVGQLAVVQIQAVIVPHTIAPYRILRTHNPHNAQI